MTRIVAVAAGHVTLDRYGDELLPGGSAWYAVRAWAALGAAGRLVTGVGDDFPADDAWAGIEADVTRGGRTTTFTNRYSETGSREQHVEAQAPPVGPRPGLRADVLFLAPVLGEIDLDAWRDVPAGLRAVGLQGWLKHAAGGAGPRLVRQEPERLDPERLAGFDVACLSDEDLAGREAWLARLRAVVPIVALTRGAAGSEIHTPAGSWRVGVYPTTPLDPTGAGDTYAAGLLLGLARGAPPPEAARLGAAAASVVVEHRGGAPLAALAEAPGRVARVPVAPLPPNATQMR